MGIKLVTSLDTLLFYASEVGNAKRSGDKVRIEKAEKNLRAYEKLCLKADEMTTHYSWVDLRPR